MFDCLPFGYFVDLFSAIGPPEIYQVTFTGMRMCLTKQWPQCL